MNNDLTNVPCQKRWYSCIHSFELQNFLEKDNFVSKFAIIKENVKLCTITFEKNVLQNKN